MQQKTTNTSISLGIHHLPNQLNYLRAGSLYSISCNNISIYFKLLLQSVLKNLNNNKKCTLISILDQDKFIQLARSFELDITPFLNNQQLTVYSLSTGNKSGTLLNNPDQLLAKLDHANISASDYLIFDAVTDLFFWHDPELAATKIAVYKAWLQKHNITALISFVTEQPPTTFSNTVKLNGSLHFTCANNRIKAQISHWQTSDHQITAMTCIVKTAIDTKTTTPPPKQQTPPNIVPLFPEKMPVQAHSDMPPIYYIGQQYGDWQPIHKGTWQQIDNFAALRRKAINPIPKLIVFTVSNQKELFQIAKTVITLRKRSLTKCRIVVREVNYALRYSDAKLLEYCGINRILQQDMSISQIKLSLTGLKQFKQRNIPPNQAYKMLLNFTLPDVRGFLSEPEFRHYILDKMPQMNKMTLPFIFAKSTLLFEGAINEEILCNAQICLRKGDIVTIISNEMWLFLVDCSPNNIAKVMTRIHNNALTWIKEIKISSDANAIQMYLKKSLDQQKIS